MMRAVICIWLIGAAIVFAAEHHSVFVGDGAVERDSAFVPGSLFKAPVMTIQPGRNLAGAAAQISLDDKMETEGWIYMHVTSDASFSDELQAYSAGYIEGARTVTPTYESILNSGYNYTADALLQDFLQTNLRFMHTQIAINAHDSYWHQVLLVLVQLQGLYDGYMDVASAEQKFPAHVFYNAQISGDMEDLEAAIGLQNNISIKNNKKKDSSVTKQPRQWIDEDQQLLQPNEAGHCSAVVRVLPGNSDVLASQITWSAFENMLRIYKLYTLPYRLNGQSDTQRVAATQMALSGYPGVLFSGDDWYTMEPTKLAVFETTIGNSNASLYVEFVKPDTVLDWIRNLVANRLATDGASWSSQFSRYNSGTYNNEFMIVDYKRFSAGEQRLQDGLLWVLDQLPGHVVHADTTEFLREWGYFGSYNSPYFKEIFELGGNAALEQKFGPWFSWNATARANLFRRDAPLVHSDLSFKLLVRQNDFQHDPLSTLGCGTYPKSSGENAIAARDDLNPKDGVYPISALGHRDHAAIDAKYTSAQLMREGKLRSWVQAGPTYDQQEVFVWSKSDYADVRHVGMPDRWQMPWVLIDWDQL